MNIKKFLICGVLPILSLSACQKPQYEDDSAKLKIKTNFVIEDNLELVDEEAKVVLLYGQSNATGISRNEYLSKNDPTTYEKYNSGFNKVKINYVCDNFNNSSSKFVDTKLGQGGSKDLFGPEAGIADIMNGKNDSKTFIIKYSYGGTTLANQWLDGKGNRGGLYNASIEMTKKSLDYLISKGYKLDILGICWMQGENDAGLGFGGYYENTRSLAGYYREDLKNYDGSIKFVDAFISRVWQNYQNINNGKLKFANESKDNIVIDTIDLGLTTESEPEGQADIAHYDSMSMVTLGREFGKSLL